MTEIGLHKRNLFEFVECKVVIEYGKLQRVWFDSKDLVHGFLPTSKTDFEFEKYSTARAEFYPDGYNYLLTYDSENGTEQVFLKLNWFKVWEMRLASRRTLLQSKELKLSVVKYLVIGSLGIFGINQCKSVYQYIRYPNTQPIANDSTERKASSKIKDSVFLTDSLRVE
ncbi:hypothetical protein [Hwangdonia sp.]|uniref:hypothetical protein n=1 Tax=Hwangdonia sp. TaxID=1883432 RepID=UPI003AB4418F